MVITLVSYRWGVGLIPTRSPILATLWHTALVHGHPLGMVSAPWQRGYTTSTTKPVAFRHVLLYLVDHVVRQQISSPGCRKSTPPGLGGINRVVPDPLSPCGFPMIVVHGGTVGCQVRISLTNAPPPPPPMYLHSLYCPAAFRWEARTASYHKDFHYQH